MKSSDILPSILICAIGFITLRFMFNSIFGESIKDARRQKEERNEENRKRDLENERRKKEREEWKRKYIEENGGPPEYFRSDHKGDLPF